MSGGIARLCQLLQDDAERPSLMGDVEPLRRDPSLIFRPLNMQPDPWQREVLTADHPKVLLLCARQTGKSQIVAAMALLEALLNPYAEVLIISRTLRQSRELLLKVKMLWRGLIGGKVHRRKDWQPRSLLTDALVKVDLIKTKGWDGAAMSLIGKEMVDKTQDRVLSQEFPNGARIVALPGTSPDTIVGFSAVTLLILDEGSRIGDNVYNLVRPFQAATEAVHGRKPKLAVASTPFGKRGWFYEAWQQCERCERAYAEGVQERQRVEINGRVTLDPSNCARHQETSRATTSSYSGTDAWLRHHWQLGYDGKEAQPPFKTFSVRASECSRISREFLDEERAMCGLHWFQQEYECVFQSTIDSVFDHDKIHAMIQSGAGETKLWFE